MDKKIKTISIFLDLDNPNNISSIPLGKLPEETKKVLENLSTDEKVAEIFIGKFIANKKAIGKRIKEMGNLGMSYSVKSVSLYHQAKELYCLEYFESAIMVCRAAAEQLAYEIFVERIDIEGEREMIELLGESLDFRKIVNDFLCSSKRKNKLINDTSKEIINDIYTLGNRWIHPKNSEQCKLDVKNEAKQAVKMLKQLIDSLRNVFDDYESVKGVLKIKGEAVKKYKRGIKLES